MACISHISLLKVRNGFLNKQGHGQNLVKKRYIIGLPTQLLEQIFAVVIHPFRYKGMSVVWSKILQMGIFPAKNLISNNNHFEILYSFLLVCKRERHKMAQLLQLVLEK